MKLAYLLILGLLPACTAPSRWGIRPFPQESLPAFQECSSTADCIRVDNGCCDCANGGDTVAIHRKWEKTFRDHFDCRGFVCTQKTDDCQFLEPICEKGFCTLGKRPQLFPQK